MYSYDNTNNNINIITNNGVSVKCQKRNTTLNWIWFSAKVQHVSKFGFIMNALVNLRTGILLKKTISVPIAAEESSLLLI
jgi:hypothetical protein